MSDEQIKQMVDRFLCWELPTDFNPDNGITFDPIASRGTPYEFQRKPVGTNLLTAQQAEAMIRHILKGTENPLRFIDAAKLREKIATDPDLPCEAGSPAAAPVCEWRVIQSPMNSFFLSGCTKKPIDGSENGYCPSCGKPIKFKSEAAR